MNSLLRQTFFNGILLFEVEKNYKYAFDDPFIKIYKI